MDFGAIGRPTYHTRVEAWECDHNQHWNVRNYMRAFQRAHEVVADLSAHPPRPGAVLTQHTRYHRELFQTSEVEVRSAVLADGPLAGALVHLLGSGGTLSATALDTPGFGADALPQVTSAEVARALPRGMDGAAHRPDGWVAPEGARVFEHGIVQPQEVDHTGALTIDGLMRRIAAATNALVNDLGFTIEAGLADGIARMGVETKITRLEPAPVGVRLVSVARIGAVGRTSVTVAHRLFRPGSADVAAADQGLVFVNLATRRATEVPPALRVAAGGN